MGFSDILLVAHGEIFDDFLYFETFIFAWFYQLRTIAKEHTIALYCKNFNFKKLFIGDECEFIYKDKFLNNSLSFNIGC